MGEFFHALLHNFALQLQERSFDWGKLTKEESWALISELADQLAPGLQHEILLSSARYRGRHSGYKLSEDQVPAIACFWILFVQANRDGSSEKDEAKFN